MRCSAIKIVAACKRSFVSSGFSAIFCFNSATFSFVFCHSEAVASSPFLSNKIRNFERVLLFIIFYKFLFACFSVTTAGDCCYRKKGNGNKHHVKVKRFFHVCLFVKRYEKRRTKVLLFKLLFSIKLLIFIIKCPHVHIQNCGEKPYMHIRDMRIGDSLLICFNYSNCWRF